MWLKKGGWWKAPAAELEAFELLDGGLKGDEKPPG